MSDETGNGDFVLYCVSGCYAEVHISWAISGRVPTMMRSFNLTLSTSVTTQENLYKYSFPLTAPSVPILFKFCHYIVLF